MVISHGGEVNHFEFQINCHKRRRFGLEEIDANLNKFFHRDENEETYQSFLEICRLFTRFGSVAAAQAVLNIEV